MEHVFSVAHKNFCHVKWSMPAPAIASCVSKINASWKKSDIENWSRRKDEDESSNVFSTINLVLEDAGGTSCRIHAFVFNSKSDFYKGVMRFNGQVVHSFGRHTGQEVQHTFLSITDYSGLR